MINNINEIISLITQGAVDVIGIEQLKKKLERKEPLIVKLGADPTAPNLHLGHAVVLEKLHDLQKLGHHIRFLIGDFTGRIGDPTGKSKTRPALSEQDIAENTKTYIAQLAKVIDINKTIIVYNSTWLDSITSKQWIQLCSKITLARIIEREDFKNRLAAHAPISLHEILYPLLQAYDSVELKADIELGGTDQTFNLLMGRHLQEVSGQEPQVVITMPILVGTDGTMKMSKSLRNDIGLMDHPHDVFGKIMSLSDEIMYHYYEILLRYSEEEVKKIKTEMHPLEAKKQLARIIVTRYWSSKDAESADRHFTSLFQEKDFSIAKELVCDKSEYPIIDFICLADSSLSRSEARRLIDSGAVYINKKKVTDTTMIYYCTVDDSLSVGKRRLFRVTKK